MSYLSYFHINRVKTVIVILRSLEPLNFLIFFQNHQQFLSWPRPIKPYLKSSLNILWDCPFKCWYVYQTTLSSSVKSMSNCYVLRYIVFCFVLDLTDLITFIFLYHCFLCARWCHPSPAASHVRGQKIDSGD